MRRLRLGSRTSALAMWQTKTAAAALCTAHPGMVIEIVPVKTTGDRVIDRPLFAIGGKGLFTKELEERLLDRSIDVAVHSLKDLPTALPEGLVIGAVLERASWADTLVTRGGGGLADLKRGAVVGTSSLRRRAQVLARRRDVDLRDLRGNVDTRLNKVASGEYDAMVCARAGLDRLGFDGSKLSVSDLSDFLPAPGQGAMAVEIASGRPEVAELVGAMDHAATRRCVTAERAMLERLGGGCHVPVGALAELRGKVLVLRGLVANPDGSEKVQMSLESDGHAEELGTALADVMIAAGAARLLCEAPENPHCPAGDDGGVDGSDNGNGSGPG